MYVDIRFDQVTLFDGESIKTDHTLLIKGEKFLWIGPTADLDENIYQYGVCINASKLYVLPGFIDSHIHLLRSAISSLGYDFSKVTDQGSPGFFAKLKEISMLERPELSFGSWVIFLMKVTLKYKMSSIGSMWIEYCQMYPLFCILNQVMDIFLILSL